VEVRPNAVAFALANGDELPFEAAMLGLRRPQRALLR
jgi:hypothetical protein